MIQLQRRIGQCVGTGLLEARQLILMVGF